MSNYSTVRLNVDFNPQNQAMKRWNKESHLHKELPIPDLNGNRAERRRAKKARKKK